MKRTTIVICVIMGFCGHAFGQSKGITPLHTFFQKNADSTLIIEYTTDSYDPYYYRMITKTGDTINTFQYNAIQKMERVTMPRKLAFLISIEKYKYFGGIADINPYFNVVNLPTDTLKAIWTKVGGLKLWEITVDNSNPKCKNIPISAHPDQIIIHFITKKEIKTLIFSSALLYEEYCPGNRNRKPVVEFYKTFDRYFVK
jgi:hypothetical protein